jgi:hypothetical protein
MLQPPVVQEVTLGFNLHEEHYCFDGALKLGWVSVSIVHLVPGFTVRVQTLYFRNLLPRCDVTGKVILGLRSAISEASCQCVLVQFRLSPRFCPLA